MSRLFGSLLAEPTPLKVEVDLSDTILGNPSSLFAGNVSPPVTTTNAAAKVTIVDLGDERFSTAVLIIRFFTYVAFVVGLMLITRNVIKW